jgi:GNAT superfamily N-acetyltransferase
MAETKLTLLTPVALTVTPDALVTLRPVRAGDPLDTAGVRDLLRRLSPASAFARFFTGLGNPSDAMLRQLVRDEPHAGSWLAESHLDTGSCGGPQIVGHASWTLDPCGVAEISVMVDDAWHSLGIGHDLVERVLAAARSRGAVALRIDVLASNRRVTAMIGRRWPDARLERDGTELTYHVALA